jgi:FixJ family two-component response regulator
VRSSLKRLLTSVDLRCETFGSAADFLPRAAQGITGCVLLDVRMPGLSGLDVQQKLNEAGNDVPIIFLTAYADVALTVRAMKAGAVELLTKPFEAQALLDAVSRALERERTRRTAREELRRYRERFETLTSREREVMQTSSARRRKPSRRTAVR